MKIYNIVFALVVLPLVSWGAKSPRSSIAKARSGESSENTGLAQAQSLIRQNRSGEAVTLLYRLSGDSRLDRQHVKFLLGTSLLNEKYPQLAAIQFVDVIRKGPSPYLRPAIDKLAQAASELGDDSLLAYAVKKIDPQVLPSSKSDLLKFQMAVGAYQAGQLAQATQLFSQIPRTSRYYFDSRYQLATLYLESKKVEEAIDLGKSLITQAKSKNDQQLAHLLVARSYYQMQDYKNALRYYKIIPRDSSYWSDMLFELSWSQLRAARFRSVLGTLQTLHSPFYDHEYMPETLIVRGIVYLYICRFDELEKTVELFSTQYGQYSKIMNQFYNDNPSGSHLYAREISIADQIRQGKKLNDRLGLPYPILRTILKEGDIQRSLKTQNRIKEEIASVDQDPKFQNSAGFIAYAKRILNRRLTSTQKYLSESVRSHLEYRIKEWKELEDQVGYLRFEMINAKKESLKQKIAGNTLDGIDIDQDRSRDFYVENGYEYWPVDREVWADELGNYFYMGNQLCR